MRRGLGRVQSDMASNLVHLYSAKSLQKPFYIGDSTENGGIEPSNSVARSDTVWIVVLQRERTPRWRVHDQRYVGL